MAQMAEIVEKKPEPKVCVDPDLIVLDKLPVPEAAEAKAAEIKKEKGLKGIIKKFSRHAKFHEDLVSLEKLKRQLTYRNFGVY